MEYNSLEEVVREDIEYFNKLVGRPRLRLEQREGDSWFILFSGKNSLWYGPIEDINVVVKSLFRLADHPAQYGMTVRAY